MTGHAEKCPKQMGTLSVIVKRSDTDEPIKGVTAAVKGPSPGSGKTDDLGAIVFKDRSPGGYTANITLPPEFSSYAITKEAPKAKLDAAGNEVLIFKAAPVGNLVVEVYDERGKLVTEEAELSGSGPAGLSHKGKTGSHTFSGVAGGTYNVSASLPSALFEAPTVSKQALVPGGGTGTVRLDVKRRLNIVTPKIEMEYKVVALDRKLSSHQEASEKKIVADDVTYVRVSASQSTGTPSYAGGAKFEVSPANVEAFADKECKTPLAGMTIENKQLLGGKLDVYLKAKTKGKFTAKLTLDAADHPNIEVKPPAEEEMSAVELEAKLHWFLRSDLEDAGMQVDPDVEPIANYHTALKDKKLPDQKPLTDADKVSKGRFLHAQSDKSSHGRAKLTVQKLVAADWPAGTDDYEVTLDAEKGGGSLKLFDKEKEGDEKPLPHKIKVKDLKAKEVELWVEGKDASKKLRDAVLQVGLDRPAGGLAKKPKQAADWSRFTVVKIKEVKLEYEKAKDEHKAWDEDKKRYYININEKGDPDGRKIELSAKLSEKFAGVPIRFMLAPDKSNGKTANWNIDFPSDATNGGNAFKWKDVKADFKHLDKADRKNLVHLMKETDKDGYAKVEVQLSRFGGDKFHPACYLEQDAHLAKYVHGHADLEKREPVFAKVRPLQVWRKIFYQATHPKATSMPGHSGFDDSQRKVFMEPVLVEEKKMTKRDFTVNPFRPDWQFNVNGTRTQKLCIGTHNVDDAMKLFVAATKATTPKFHVVLCDEQFDAKNVRTDAKQVVFHAAANAAQDVEMSSSNVDDDYLTICDPPLQGGALIIGNATWQAKEHVAGAWTNRQSGTLPAGNVTLRKDRASKRTVRVTPPAGIPIDATHAIVVTLRLQAADGGYNGWAPSGHPANVVKGGRATYAIHNTMGHELGHLFGGVRTTSVAGMPDHPLFYEKRGGSGSHCAFNATFNADPTATPLNPATQGERDAQGKGAGKWDDGTCIIFGYSRPMKREWCKHCALEYILSDLSEFRS
jgi:hypothetical protein